MNLRHRVEAKLVRSLPRSASRALGGLYGFVLPASRSYSQYGEDRIIASFFDEVGVSAGTYVDIGAFHPRWLSNTHLLASRGWRGVVVDIDEQKVRLCERARRDCVGVVAAVAPEGSPSQVPVYRFDRLWSEIDTLSEVDAREARDRTGIDFEVQVVPTVGIHDVLERARNLFGSIELLNIDIEGVDEVVLGEIDFERFPVGVVCFEDNHRFAGSEATVATLTSHGYRHLATSGGSHIWVRSELVAAGRWDGERA